MFSVDTYYKNSSGPSLKKKKWESRPNRPNVLSMMINGWIIDKRRKVILSVLKQTQLSHRSIVGYEGPERVSTSTGSQC